MTLYIEQEKFDCMKPWAIKAAAIKQDGCVYWSPPPARHHDLIRMMAKFLPTPISGEQGFLLEKGAFAGRKFSLRIAKEAGQIVKKHGHAGMLFSEDMW